MGSNRSRKWQLTFNNPADHNWTHEELNANLDTFSGIKYYCMCDEMGTSYHTHLYIEFINPRTFETIQNAFRGAHIEKAIGSAQQNRDYIRKEGKHADTDKAETNLIDTFEEFGTVPEEHQGKRRDLYEAYDMLKNGCTVHEIIDEFPHLMVMKKTLDEFHESLLFEKYRDITRDITVIYQYGDTGTGKSRGVYEKNGFRNVFVVSNYKNPFDGYAGQPVIMFEEFRGQLPLADMLQYLDRYPCRLPARYSDKVACYTTVYINSNIPLSEQYKQEQIHEPRSYDAFIRRINKCFEYKIQRENAESGI